MRFSILSIFINKNKNKNAVRQNVKQLAGLSVINNQRGFTLVEIIISIVVLSIALAIVTSLIAPTEKQSADNMLQIKAAELGQSLLNDISSRAFDQKSDMTGGLIRCDQPSADACTAANKLGPEDGKGGRDDEDEDNRSLYNDVDDFHGFTDKVNAENDNLGDSYSSFLIEVNVVYAGDDLGLDNLLAKRITVSVTTPLGTEIKFATHKANF
jgi:MSHA pilin protein MshD